MVRVKISAAMLRQQFRPCDPEFIRDVCHARCCDAPSRPTGMMVVIHPTEIARIESYGAHVDEAHHLLPVPGTSGCPFKDRDTCLCTIHADDMQPFGCTVSPFTVNQNGTLIIRNRYRMLPCYKAADALPAYLAHMRSLSRIIGQEQCTALVQWLDAGRGDTYVDMDQATYDMLITNDQAKKV